MEHVIDIFLNILIVGLHRSELLHHRVILDHRARRFTDHVIQTEVDRLVTVGTLEDELHVARRLTHHVHRRTLTVGDTFDQIDILILHQEAHALLALVADDLLVGQGRVTDRQLVHIDLTTRRLHQLGEAVQVTARAMVVDRYDRVIVGLRQGADHVRDTFLHLRVGTLHSVQLDRIGVLTRLHRRDSATAHTDAVIVTTHHDHLLARLRLALQTILLFSEAYATRQHDDLVVSIFLVVLRMLVGEQ